MKSKAANVSEYKVGNDKYMFVKNSVTVTLSIEHTISIYP